MFLFLFMVWMTSPEFICDLDQRPADSQIRDLIRVGDEAFFIHKGNLNKWDPVNGFHEVDSDGSYYRLYQGGSSGFFYRDNYGNSLKYWSLETGQGQMLMDWSRQFEYIDNKDGVLIYKLGSELWLINTFTRGRQKVALTTGTFGNILFLDDYAIVPCYESSNDYIKVFNLHDPNESQIHSFESIESVFLRGDWCYVLANSKTDTPVLSRLSKTGNWEEVFKFWNPTHRSIRLEGTAKDDSWPVIFRATLSEENEWSYYIFDDNKGFSFLGHENTLGNIVSYDATTNRLLLGNYQFSTKETWCSWLDLETGNVLPVFNKPGSYSMSVIGINSKGSLIRCQAGGEIFSEVPFDLEYWFVGVNQKAARIFQKPQDNGDFDVQLASQNGDQFLLWVEHGRSGKRLWKTDGTLDGTHPVSSTVPMTKGTDFMDLQSLAVGDYLLFNGFSDLYGKELMVSDGENIRLVADLETGTRDDLNQVELFPFNNRLFYSKATPEFGSELWSYGTEGEQMIKDLYVGAGGSNPHSLTVFKDQLYLAATLDVGNQSIFKWDFDSQLLPIEQEPDTSRQAEQLIGFKNFLYFSGYEPCQGTELLRTDGNEKGVRLFANLARDYYDNPYCSPESSSPTKFRSWNGGLFFQTNEWADFTFWRYLEGVLTGLQKPTYDEPVFCPDFIYFIKYFQEEIYFVDNSGNDPQFLMGLPVLEDNEFGYERKLANVGNRLALFRIVKKQDGTQRLEIFTTEPFGDWSLVFDEKVVPLNNLPFSVWSSETYDPLYFTYNHPEKGRELFRLNSDATITEFGDLNPGVQGSDPIGLTSIGGSFFFSAFQPDKGRELWRVRNNSETIELVTDFDNGPFSSEPNQVVAVGNSLFIEAKHPTMGTSLFRLDWPRYSAGSDQLVCGRETKLQGAIPENGTGFWQVLQGEGGSFEDETRPDSMFYGEQGRDYLLRWTAFDEDGESYADETILEFFSPPENGSSGPDIILCLTTETNLQGVQPDSGYGKWRAVSGLIDIRDAFAPQSEISLMEPFQESYRLEWVQTNGTCNQKVDDLLIQTINPTHWPEGEKIYFCDPIAQLHAPTVPGGTGQWSINWGEGGNFSDVNDPNAIFEGLRGNSYGLQWTIDSEQCGTIELNRNVHFLRLAQYEIEGPRWARPGDEIVLTGPEGQEGYIWSTGGTQYQETIQVQESMTVTLVMTNTSGCQYTLTHDIQVIDLEHPGFESKTPK